jgi:hypothetical protein
VNDLTGLLDTAAAELPAARSAITAGDEEAGRLAKDFDRLIASVDTASRSANARAAQLHGDDVMAPAGKARLLSELPHDLVRATKEQLAQAEVTLDVIEGRYLSLILAHDGREDANLRAELDNYVAAIKPQTAAATLVGLAGDVRYSTYMAGPMGKSLAARFGLDPAIFRKVALEALAVNGTPAQVARSKALAALPAARRVIELARAGRDHIADESQRPPKPAPSTALMS